MTEKTLLWGHVDEATAYLVEDYPYGYRLRTQIRYWIETTKHGDRMASQTLNPKTGAWNKAKKSTYVEVGILFLNEENGHVEWMGLHHGASEEAVQRYLALAEHLSEAQKGKLAAVVGLNKAMEGVTWDVVVNPSAEESAALRKHEAQTFAVIGHRAAVATAATLEAIA